MGYAQEFCAVTRKEIVNLNNVGDKIFLKILRSHRSSSF